jgi:alkylphosphonate utilization operon protein PhnA
MLSYPIAAKRFLGMSSYDLKIKGSSQVVKVSTKVKNIRLVDGDHNIDCKIDG